eukprot:11132879-Alexandrium_andersonii.AAC.1
MAGSVGDSAIWRRRGCCWSTEANRGGNRRAAALPSRFLRLPEGGCRTPDPAVPHGVAPPDPPKLAPPARAGGT